MGEPKAVEIRAELRQIKTMADHSVNVLLNVGEEYVSQVGMMMGWMGDLLRVILVDEIEQQEKPGYGL